MKTKKEIRYLLKQAQVKRNWELSLAAMSARNEIPETIVYSAALLCQLAYVYIGAAYHGREYDAYMRLAKQALRRAQAVADEREKRDILRCAGYMYYKDYIFYGALGRKGIPCHRQPKSILLAKARACYEALLKEERLIRDVYQYAYLLYKSADDYFLPLATLQRRQQQEEAYTLFSEVISRWEGMTEQDQERERTVAQKAYYNLCQCGLHLLQSAPWLNREFQLLFNVQIPLQNLPARKQRFREVLRNLEHLCIRGGIPSEMTDINLVSRLSQAPFPHAGEFYYSLGKLYECAHEQNLCNCRQEALQKAEQYYSYACAIDLKRRQLNLPVSGFIHMYAALFRIYIYRRQEKEFVSAWKYYHHQLHFSEGLQVLYRIRWQICRAEYKKAKKTLEQYIKTGNYETSLTKRNAQVFMDILDTLINQNTQGLKGGYKSFQRWYFRQLLIKRKRKKGC